ncbi:hypothetical protein C8F04DRAFT_1267152 [Mycena alexandri]|uniref:Uncharacterized protein n=1 Tax=Mycena alexandri TaxID=1745969 RepID=A0AAD6SKG3_9AGAR|nr:hypothetical protein C8F04DRAFT_1267152 [Mycena alexandri]
MSVCVASGLDFGVMLDPRWSLSLTFTGVIPDRFFDYHFELSRSSLGCAIP